MKQYFEADSNVSVRTGESVLICGLVGEGKTTIQVSLFSILFLLTDLFCLFSLTAVKVYNYNMETTGIVIEVVDIIL